jgi:oligopeptide transport system permease protein
LLTLAVVTLASLSGPPIIAWATGYTYDYIPRDHSLVRALPPFTDVNGSFAWTHPMGTDAAGRDLLARVLVGGRVSLAVGLIATAISLLIGIPYGAVAGYVGGRLDAILMRLVDVLYALPYILLVVVLLAVFGRRGGASRVVLLFAALGAISWLTVARVVRGQVLSLMGQEYILAARALGASPCRVLWRHVLPNALDPVIVYAALTMPSIMLQEGLLSFLGLGVQSPLTSWGSLAADGVSNMSVFPWLLACPGIVMGLTILALNFIGDGVRDALDPQT